MGHSDDMLESNSVQSDRPDRIAEDIPKTRNLRKCKTFAR
jgi:hypothetical protein